MSKINPLNIADDRRYQVYKPSQNRRLTARESQDRAALLNAELIKLDAEQLTARDHISAGIVLLALLIAEAPPIICAGYVAAAVGWLVYCVINPE